MDFDRSEILYSRGADLERRGKWVEALAYFEDLLNLDSGALEERAFFLFASGRLYLRIGQYDKARARFSKLARLCVSLKKKDKSRIYNELSFLYYRQGNLKKAFAALKRGTRYLEGLEQSAPFAQNLHYSGLYLYSVNRRIESMENLKRALSIYKMLDNSHEHSQVLDTMGMCFLEMGEVEEAINYFRESLEMKEKIGDQYGIAISYGNLGRSLLKTGSFDEAVRYFERDLEISEELKDSHGIMVMCNNLGRAYTMSGLRDRGKELLIRSLNLANENRNETWEAISMKDLAYSSLCNGDYDRALTQIGRALDTFKRLEKRAFAAEAIMFQGMILRAKGHFRQSIRCFLETIRLSHELDAPFQLAESLFQMGLLYQKMGEKRRALEYLEKAIDIAEKLKAAWLLSKFEGLLAEFDEGEWLRLCLKRYLGNELLDSVLRTRRDTFGSGALLEATVLFLNLWIDRELFERENPEKIVSLFNEYFGHFAEIAAQHKGIVEGFIGEEMMIYFGVPRGSYDDPLRGVECARAVMRETGKLKERSEKQGLFSALSSAGINSGEVYAGNIGAYLRMQFKITGSTVNLASRLLHKAKPGQILVSEKIYDEVKGEVPAIPLPPMKIKGLKEEQKVWEIPL